VYLNKRKHGLYIKRMSSRPVSFAEPDGEVCDHDATIGSNAGLTYLDGAGVRRL